MTTLKAFPWEKDAAGAVVEWGAKWLASSGDPQPQPGDAVMVNDRAQTVAEVRVWRSGEGANVRLEGQQAEQTTTQAEFDAASVKQLRADMGELEKRVDKMAQWAKASAAKATTLANLVGELTGNVEQQAIRIEELENRLAEADADALPTLEADVVDEPADEVPF